MASESTFRIVIPARYNSSRFPGKPLAKIAGVPMVLRVYERAIQTVASEVIIATDDERIAQVCEQAGAPCCMTSEAHTTGTDRIAEVARLMNWQEDEIVVNVQGDEPLIPLSSISQVAENLRLASQASIATLATPIVDSDELADPTNVKVVFDCNGIALYFSRSVIPHDRDKQATFEASANDLFFRHLGLYAYRVGFLLRYTKMPECRLEQLEKLEQLRALWNGERIHVAIASELPGMGVDTPAQLEQVAQLFGQQL